MNHSLRRLLSLTLLLFTVLQLLSCAKIREWTSGTDTTAPVTTNDKPVIDPTVQEMRKKLCYTFLVLTEGEGGIGTLHTISYAALDVNGDRMQLSVLQLPKQLFINAGTINSLSALYEKTYADSIANGFDPQSSQSRAINELRAAISQDMMLPCDYYLYLTKNGIASLVDDLDGVELPVPFFMNFPDGSYISTGTQKLTGSQVASMLYYQGYGEGSLLNASKRIFAAIFMKVKTTIRSDVLPLFMIELREAVKSDIPQDAGEDIYFVRKTLGLPADSVLMTSAPTRLVPLLGGNVNVICASDMLEKINGYMVLYSQDLTIVSFDKKQRFNDVKDPYVSSVYASSGMSAPVFTAAEALTEALSITK